MSWTGLRLEYPLALLALLLLPLLAYLWTRPWWRGAIRFSSLAPLHDAGARRATPWRRVLEVLRLAALACLIVAAARPQRPNASTRIYAEGIAILLVIDVSSSMDDRDLSPPGQAASRLDVVKEVARRFVVGDGALPGRPNDLIGLIRFAGYADSVCPLTLDHDAVVDVLGKLQTVQAGRSREDGTAIGDGLALAVERLKDLKRTVGSGEQLEIRSRVVILLTDGENNRGMITPAQAGELAATYGIKVYTIMAGTGAVNLGFRMPVDDGVLRGIAEVTGGRHFHAADARSLESIYAEIDRLERTRVEERRFALWEELSRPWLLAAFAALALQVVLDATWLRRIP